ncbi:hypothetical protein ACF0H5_016806 [Mactra antiquata]
MTKISIADVLQAHYRIKPFLPKTPVLTSSTFDAMHGRKFYFKAENMQKTGSFKVRGALNAIIKLQESGEPVKGVTTHSSGNHGQALAWAASKCGLKCNVITPHDTPNIKIRSIEGYGASVTLCEPNPTSREETCQRVTMETGYSFVPSSDHYDIMAGQGTIALEFLDEVPNLDAILIPASKGGMAAGIAITAKSLKPNIKIFVVEPKGKDLERCLIAGERLWPNPPQFVDTIADGIRIQQLGKLTWPILLKLAEKEVFTADNEEIMRGMKFAFQRMKVVIEGASGAAVAAAMSDRLRKMDDSIKNVGVILCGGNVDIDQLPWYKGK